MRYCKSTSFQANHNQFSQFVVLLLLFAILQKYEFSSKSQLSLLAGVAINVVCDTAKVRVFKQITTYFDLQFRRDRLFAILQKYEFSSKSQPRIAVTFLYSSCLRYCKSTSFQANHNIMAERSGKSMLFAILQKYEFSSKSQPRGEYSFDKFGCLRYCKSTSFQANHNDKFFALTL